MDAAKLIDKYVMNTYGRAPITFVQGEGLPALGRSGQSIHRFFGGASRVVSLGHAHPEVTKAVCEQAAKLVHVSNLYYTEPQARVAELLVGKLLCRQGVLLQLRGRGQRGRPQAGPSLGQREDGRSLHHHHHGAFLPRPDPGHPFGHGPG